MVDITVVHMFKERCDFKCGLLSPLANPFIMARELDRDEVCDKYYDYFHTNLNPDLAPPDFLEYLDDIRQFALLHGKVTLGCLCAPKRCHCDTIKNWLETDIQITLNEEHTEMKTIDYFELVQLSSGHLTTDHYPDNWNDMDSSDQEEWLSDHVWEPFENYRPAEVAKLVDSIASATANLLERFDIPVSGR